MFVYLLGFFFQVNHPYKKNMDLNYREEKKSTERQLVWQIPKVVPEETWLGIFRIHVFFGKCQFVEPKTFMGLY